MYNTIIKTAMFARINSVAYVYTTDNKMRDWLKENAGKLVEIETGHLFNNQYNTAEYRIYDSMISEIVNDARVDMGSCKYCGTMLHRSDVACLKHGECVNHGVNWFTPENTYFLKYPQGVKNIEHKISAVQDKPVKFGTYYLDAYPVDSLNYFRLTNGRKRIDFKYQDGLFFIHNGIGYKQSKGLDIPAKELTKLIAFLNKIVA